MSTSGAWLADFRVTILGLFLVKIGGVLLPPIGVRTPGQTGSCPGASQNVPGDVGTLVPSSTDTASRY